MDVEKKKQKGILDYIFQFAGEYKGAYIKSVVFAVVGVAFSLAPYALMGDMVKKLLSGEQDFNIYLREGLVMATFWILRVFFHTLSTKTSHKTTFKLIGNVRIALVDKLSRLPLGTVQGMPSGALKNIICERTDSMEPTLAHVVPEFTANLCAPIMLFIYILTIDWRIALLSLATLPVAGIAMVWMLKDSSVRFQRTQDTTKDLNDTAVEYIGGIEVIKVRGIQDAAPQVVGHDLISSADEDVVAGVDDEPLSAGVDENYSLSNAEDKPLSTNAENNSSPDTSNKLAVNMENNAPVLLTNKA